jgi:hypothetical protein
MSNVSTAVPGFVIDLPVVKTNPRDWQHQMAANAAANEMHMMGLFYTEQGKNEQAETSFKDAIALLKRVQFPKSHYIITMYRNYADMLRKDGRPKEAAAMEAKAKAEEKRAKNDK